jgi:hypothetical protein
MGVVVRMQARSSNERERRQLAPGRRIRAGQGPERARFGDQAAEAEANGGRLAVVRTRSLTSATVLTSFVELDLSNEAASSVPEGPRDVEV